MQKWLTQMCVFLFARFYWETSWFCRAQAHPPQNLNIHSLQTHTAPKLCLFGYNTPLSCPRPPRCPSPPPSLPLSPSLGFCLGAVRALLQSRYGKDHIQWGLSQSLSVSIKDPGNTTLSTFKGPASLLNLSPGLGLPAPPFISMQPLESLKSISYSWMLCERLQTVRVTITHTQARLHQHTLLHWTAEGNQQQQQLLRLQPVTSHTVCVEFGEYFPRISTRFSRHKPSFDFTVTFLALIIIFVPVIIPLIRL